MRFEWDEEKARTNLSKHGVSFEIASAIFDDPFRVSTPDRYVGHEERWMRFGVLPNGIALFIAYTFLADDEDDVIRIISARRATAHERRILEEAF